MTPLELVPSNETLEVWESLELYLPCLEMFHSPKTLFEVPELLDLNLEIERVEGSDALSCCPSRSEVGSVSEVRSHRL